METVLDGHARRQAAKRAAILAAATEVFFEEGYGRASMDQVLARTGGSKRTLYNHFRSKEDLFAAIVTSVSDRVLVALRPALGGSIRETLAMMGGGYLRVLVSPDGRALYRAMVSEASHFPDLAGTFFDNGPGRASRHLAEFLQEKKREGILNVADTQCAAEQFLGMVRGDLHLATVLSNRIPTEHQIDRAVGYAVETFLQGAAPGSRQ